MTGDLSDEQAEGLLKPVMVSYDDQQQVGYEVDRGEGLVAVYIPGAPNPRAGAISYVPPDRVRPIDASFKSVARTCRNLGRGSAAALAG